MPSDTAVLYDIENLIGGLSPRQREQLGLVPFEQRLQEAGYSRFSVQRAYANWNDSRISARLRSDITGSQVETVQTGSGRYGSAKNASDMHLLMDAMELALTHPHLGTFVIVSGDGDFTPLAQRLRTFGKQVVGCAIPHKVNWRLQAACDDFVLIDDPFATSEPAEDVLEKIIPMASPADSRPVIARLVRELGRHSIRSYDQLLTHTRLVMRWLMRDHTAGSLLWGAGLPAAWVLDALWYSVQGFRQDFLKSPTLGAYMRVAAEGLDLKVVDEGPNDVRLLAAQEFGHVTYA